MKKTGWDNVTAYSFKFSIARIVARFWRFRSLKKAEHIFRSVTAPLILKIGLFGYDCYLDVSRSSFQQMLYLDGKRLIGERFLVASLLRPGMRIIDVGANIGYYLLMFERAVGPAGEVICIEPSPENLIELKTNIEKNAFRNVRLFQEALGAEEGTVAIKSGINGGIADSGQGAYRTRICSLDVLVKDHIDFLKIDVDGYEWHVLKGARGLIERDRPILFLEFHPLLIDQFGGGWQELLDFLRCFYSDIAFYDVPDHLSLFRKIVVRYFDLDPVRRIEVADLSSPNLHNGRQFGTFWIVCR